MADENTPATVDAETSATDEKPAKAKKTAALVEIRVLRDHLDHKCNDVASLSEGEAATAVAEGWGDDSAAAVAYAKSLAAA
ncbi:hypothetical protein BH10PSE14_BH10PSE14_04410 [soil metagenome]